MAQISEKLTELLKAMIEKEYKTEVGKCNIVMGILLFLTIIILENSDKTSQLIDKGIFIGFFVALIAFFIFCMIFVFIVEKIYLKIKEKEIVQNVG